MAETKVKEQTRSAVDAQTITASTTTTFSNLTRCIYVGTAGNLGVKFSSGGATITFTNVANGYHPLQVEVVTQATTADGVIALF
tara:strand:- start:340 stop:591 length:252 start_codon:yes stop_codon:yes gene_type:complete